MIPLDATYLVKYGPAMQIKDQAEADAYFEACVRHCMQFGKTREEAEKIERANLGYFAGYYNEETRHRVEKLYKCSHPVFGKIAEVGAPFEDEAFQIGLEMGKKSKSES